ncbi:hypothetical protein GGS21DRAFT_161207 [Xylaria nigripes]|nr:hypothetical protein GGS21DRAFT_161207 [Xylaria nigripes]
MAADLLPATLGFLTDAAHLLVSASPEMSAHLMSQRNSLMFHNGLDQSDVSRQHVCGCCGHIMIFGHGDQLKIESSKTARKKRTSGNQKTTKASPLPSRRGCLKTLTCSKCGRYTKVNLPPPTGIPKRRSTQAARVTVADPTAMAPSRAAGAPMGVTALSSESAKPSANASSKKRAKNRKQGLQALLQQSSSSKPQAGHGLSLADFMQN